MTPEPAPLARRFDGLDGFTGPQRQAGAYTLLPFNFIALGDRYFLSNDAGDYVLVARSDLVRFVHHELPTDSEVYRTLRAKHFLYDDESDAALELLALKIRTKHAGMRQFTSLHLFVVSLRCDYSCPYCQVSRQQESAASMFDMTPETADASLDFVFRSPSPAIKIEFQGGEPLLNFPIVKYVVEQAEQRNETERRNLQFVIATNLTFISDEILAFCFEHDIYISTSLDGPEDIHNGNRPRRGKDGYQRTREGIDRVRAALGPDKVAALMTTTKRSLENPRAIIDEYVEAGFRSVFLRPLSPYGFAVKTHQVELYDFDRFFEFYSEGLEYIFELNRQGVPMREEYTTLMLRKLLSPYPTSYVDLQSPAGAGISVIAFNYDGRVFATDESRMLAEMGDDRFCLGNVRTDRYEDILLSPALVEALEDSLTVSTPECHECAFRPYCGSDPIYHYATQRDIVGHKAFSAFCQRTKRVTAHLIERLESDSDERDILMGWAQE